jgi:arabinofuranosyltransferase
MGYYGLLTPLPGLTKEAGATDWFRGWLYLVDYVMSYRLWILFLVLAVLLGVRVLRRSASSEQRIVTAAAVSAALATAFYVVRVGGDWMHARMLLAPTFLLLLPVLTVPVPVPRRTRPFPSGRPSAAAVSSVVSFLVLLTWVAVAVSPWRAIFTGGSYNLFLDVRADAVRMTHAAHPTAVGWQHAFPDDGAAVNAIQRHSGPVLLMFGRDHRLHPVDANPRSMISQVPIAVSAGYLGVAGSRVPLDEAVIDNLSLGYPLGAHFALRRLLWPGHEKLIDPTWVVADLGAADAALPPEVAPDVDPGELAAARHALTCGRLAELQASVRRPLTLSRFWRNLTGAPARTSLRIPRDPRQAEQAFCRPVGSRVPPR